MFARTVKVVVGAITLVIGTACKDATPGCGDCDTYSYAAVARGANVVPAAADTTPRASANVTTNITPNTLGYSYSVTTAPAGTIDSIALYQVAAGAALPPNATAVLCAGAAACAARTGTAAPIAPATATTIRTSMRGYGTQVVFFTTTAQKAAGGAMRGVMVPNP